MKAEELVQTMTLDEGINATLEGMSLTIKGPKGELTRSFPSKRVILAVSGNTISFSCKNATLREKKLLYTFMAHAGNMCAGVQEGHYYELKICSGHFPMNVSLKGNTLEIKNFIGEAVPRKITIKEGAEVKIEGDKITVTGIDKERVAQTAAHIESMTKRPGFDTRIFQDGIYLTVKDGKKL